MSDFSIEECIRHLTAIRAKIQKEMPDIKMWQSVEKNIEDEAEITLLLAQGKPPAFGEVHILFMLSDVDELEVHLESTSFCTDEFPQITDPKSLTDLIGKIAKLTSQYVKIAITNAFCIDEGSVSTPPTEIKFVWEPDSFDSEGNKENGSKNLISNKDASNTEGDEMDDEEYHQIDEEEVAQVVYEKVIVLRKIIDLLMAQKDSAGKEQ